MDRTLKGDKNFIWNSWGTVRGKRCKAEREREAAKTRCTYWAGKLRVGMAEGI